VYNSFFILSAIYGTRKGPLDYETQNELSKNAYVLMVTDLKKEPFSKELNDRQVNLWEMTYAKLASCPKPINIYHLFLQDNLPQLRNFDYYQSYAQHILRLYEPPHDLLKLNLGKFLSVLPDLHNKYKKTMWVPGLKELADAPFITAIRIIASLLDEANILTRIPENSTESSDITTAMDESRLCNVIVKTEEGKYTVASNGIPFIHGLSDSKAATVFATAPDVLNFDPANPEGKEAKKSAKKCHTTVEFLRRAILAVPDRTCSKKCHKGLDGLSLDYFYAVSWFAQKEKDFSLDAVLPRAVAFVQNVHNK